MWVSHCLVWQAANSFRIWTKFVLIPQKRIFNGKLTCIYFAPLCCDYSENYEYDLSKKKTLTA